MTVSELIAELQKHDPSRLVVMSIDPEGNGFQELSEIGTQAYADGEVGIESLTDELRAKGYGEEDILDSTPALVLWP